MTWGKCVFCEGRLGAQAYPQIEHYVSRKSNPQRAFEWENLFAVCEICNGSKLDTDHQGTLLKPDAEDPELFFWIGPEGDIKPLRNLSPSKKSRATETIRLCKLNRSALCEARRAVAALVSRWIERAALAGSLDELLEAEWSAIADPSFNYKIVVRHVLAQKGLHVRAEKDRELFQRGR